MNNRATPLGKLQAHSRFARNHFVEDSCGTAHPRRESVSWTFTSTVMIHFPSGNPGLVLDCTVKDPSDMDYLERTGNNSDYMLGHLVWKGR